MGSTSYHTMLLVINSLGGGRTNAYMYAYTYTHACTRMQSCTYIYTHAHTCTYTRIHTHQLPGQTNFKKSGVCVPV